MSYEDQDERNDYVLVACRSLCLCRSLEDSPGSFAARDMGSLPCSSFGRSSFSVSFPKLFIWRSSTMMRPRDPFARWLVTPHAVIEKRRCDVISTLVLPRITSISCLRGGGARSMVASSRFRGTEPWTGELLHRWSRGTRRVTSLWVF